ncbi:hypothetical protein QOZ80_8AG0617440 [Eleusine coracana subsp. coracana]|nr:hypothetical protein QOZ80_8AG0617440 [Eleusine coracana subsp. coracana]
MMDTPGCKIAKAMASVGDRISSLPDELLHHIMSLPARDAVCAVTEAPGCRACHLSYEISEYCQPVDQPCPVVPFLNKIMSNCSALEDLEMINCAIVGTEFSSATLKNLSIDYKDFPDLETCEYEDYQDIVINMPSLVSLRIGSLLRAKPILVEVQSLLTASISVDNTQSVTFADACDTLSALSNVKNVELLALYDVEGERSLQSDMQLCQTRSPNLEILTLKLKNWFPWDDGGMKPPCEETTEPFHCKKLKKIEIIYPRHNKRVGMLMTILFANIITPPEINIKPLLGYSMYEYPGQSND